MKKILIALAITALFASNACAILFAPGRLTVKTGKTVQLTAINQDKETTMIRLRFEFEPEAKTPNVKVQGDGETTKIKKPVITVYPKLMTLKPGTNKVFNITPRVPGKYRVYIDTRSISPGEEAGDENTGKGGGRATFINMNVPMEVTE